MCTVIIWTKEKLHVKFSHTLKVIIYDSAYGKHPEHVRKFAAQAEFLILGLTINLHLSRYNPFTETALRVIKLCAMMYREHICFFEFQPNRRGRTW